MTPQQKLGLAYPTLQLNGKSVATSRQLAAITGKSYAGINWAVNKGHLVEHEIPGAASVIIIDDYIAYLDEVKRGAPRKAQKGESL
ncbi:MAG: hypothetical protein WCL08_00210 [Verrucomicrobiota bacterium]